MSRIGVPLRRRIALAVALAAGLSAAGVAVVAHALAERLESRVATERTERTKNELRVRLETAGSSVATRIEALSAAVAETVAVSPSAELDLAADLASEFGIDVLTILDRHGRVLSSAHWPERLNLVETSPPAYAGSPFRVSAVSTASGDRLAILAAHGSGEFLTDGGHFLDDGFLDRLWPGAAVEIRTAETPVAPGTVEVALPGITGARLAVPVAGPPPGFRFDPMGWLGWVAIATGFGALLAGTVWARRWTRPLDDMGDAFDAVGRGQADYDFPHPRGDGFAEMTASFSRMRHSLDRQRTRLREVERVAAWKEAARRVAHEVKNPLVPIRLTMENLRKARERAPERFDAMFDDGTTAVLEEVERLQRIVSAFGEYAALPAPRFETTDLDREVDGVLALHDDGRVERVRVDPLGTVAVDRDQFARALRNLVGNGLDACGEGGRVVVRTFVEGGDAVIEVLDDGPGFGPAGVEPAFVPYVTTKPGGTGLGLAITHRIVTEHGGRLIAADRPEGGASVTIRLPRTGSTP